MRDRIDDLCDRYGRPLSLFGWSLGGIFARDLARRMPDSVRQVFTLGSPFRLTRHSQSRASRVFDSYSHLHVEHPSLPLEPDGQPDAGSVDLDLLALRRHRALAACLDTPGERCENIAVMASHLRLGHHPAAIWAITDRLAQPEGSWRPFRPPVFLRPAFPRPDAPAPLADEVAAA